MSKKTTLSLTEDAVKHQLKIAASTLKMSDAGASLLGGMSKSEAAKLIARHKGREHAVKSLKQSGHTDQEIAKLLEGKKTEQDIIAESISTKVDNHGFEIDLDRAIGDHDSERRFMAARHPKAQDHHIEKGLSDEDWVVRHAAAKNPVAKDHHIEKALSDNDYMVRMGAAENPSAKPSHLEKAAKDPHWAVRAAARRD
jgi:hypothetical protein